MVELIAIISLFIYLFAVISCAYALFKCMQIASEGQYAIGLVGMVVCFCVFIAFYLVYTSLQTDVLDSVEKDGFVTKSSSKYYGEILINNKLCMSEVSAPNFKIDTDITNLNACQLFDAALYECITVSGETTLCKLKNNCVVTNGVKYCR